jgi:ribonuclease HI
MNDNLRRYDLIQIHFDTRTISGSKPLCYLVAAVGDGSGEFEVITDEFEPRENAHGELAARIVDTCMKVASNNPQAPIEALVYNSGPRKNILAIGSEFGHVRFALQSELNKSSAGGQIVTEKTHSWVVGTPEVVQEDSGSEPMTFVATDGSLNKFYAGGSYGWISSDGEFGYGGVVRGESSLICELIAIKEMLSSMKRDNVRVLVDNRLAIKISREPDSMGDSKLVSKRALTLARSIADLVKKRKNVEFRWIKGHSGHPLNEGADRLARNARLAQSFDQDSTTVSQIAQTIADDITEEYNAYAETVR